jgi:hypothetical protein
MNNIHENIFYILLYLSYLLYFLAYFRLFNYDSKYLEILDELTKFYVIIFLLIRFNPFRKIKFTEFDREVIFSSALFLLTTTAFNSYIENYILQI